MKGLRWCPELTVGVILESESGSQGARKETKSKVSLVRGLGWNLDGLNTEWRRKVWAVQAWEIPWDAMPRPSHPREGNLVEDRQILL